MAIVIIAVSKQVADDLGWVGRIEVDIGRIKICHFREVFADMLNRQNENDSKEDWLA